MSKVLFWDVDTQVDFMEPGGKLYVPGAEKIVSTIQRLTQFAAEHNIPIISSMCAHLPSDPEFAEYPPHCLVGTPGQKKIPGTMLPNHFVVPNRKIKLPQNVGSYPQIVIEKQATDVFSNPNTEDLLQQLCAEWNVTPESANVILYGVVTEICVDLAARGLIQRSYRITLLNDAIQHLSPERGQASADYVTQHGGSVESWEEALKGLAPPVSTS